MMSIAKPTWFTALWAGLLATPALAADDLLLRKAMDFHTCPQAIADTLRGLGADQAHVHVTADTGAHYRVKLVSTSANLVFLCNAVTGELTITRTTPGELVAAMD